MNTRTVPVDELERDKFIRAFVAGHDWFRWVSTGATSFPSERDQAEDEANKRFDAMLAAAPPQNEPTKVAVGGQYVDGTIAQFVHRADVLLDNEQHKPNPDNALIAFLCDSIRMTREYMRAVRGEATNAAPELEAKPGIVEAGSPAPVAAPERGYVPGVYDRRAQPRIDATGQEPVEAHPPCTGANDPVPAAPLSGTAAAASILVSGITNFSGALTSRFTVGGGVDKWCNSAAGQADSTEALASSRGLRGPAPAAPSIPSNQQPSGGRDLEQILADSESSAPASTLPLSAEQILDYEKRTKLGCGLLPGGPDMFIWLCDQALAAITLEQQLAEKDMEIARLKQAHLDASTNAHMHYTNSGKWKERAEKAEAELAELKARAKP